MKKIVGFVGAILLFGCLKPSATKVKSEEGDASQSTSTQRQVYDTFSCPTIDRNFPSYWVEVHRDPSALTLDVKVIRATSDTEGTVAHFPGNGSFPSSSTTPANGTEVAIAIGNVGKLDVKFDSSSFFFKGQLQLNGEQRDISCSDEGTFFPPGPDHPLDIIVTNGKSASVTDLFLNPAGSPVTLAAKLSCKKAIGDVQTTWTCGSQGQYLLSVTQSNKNASEIKGSLVAPDGSSQNLSCHKQIPIRPLTIATTIISDSTASSSTSSFECDNS